MREVATTRGPDGEEGDGVEGAEGDEGVEGGHEGGDFDAVDGGVPEGDEDAAGEDGDCEGEEADKGDVGDFEVFVEEGAEDDLQGGVGGVGEEEGFLCAGAVGGRGEGGVGLEGSEVDVYRLPGEEEEGSDEGWNEAV